MRSLAEFRISEKKATHYLPSGVGVDLGSGVRKVVVDTEDPLFVEIGRVDRVMRAEGSGLYTSWKINRRYSAAETGKASLLQLWPRRTFEPCGEECGTGYDDSQACPECGSGAPQTTALRLDGRGIPSTVDIARTIANEIVVSDEFAEVVHVDRLSGCELRRVELTSPRGSETRHYQLRVVGDAVALHQETRVGEDPFDTASYGRCSRGDLVGLNLLSEVIVDRGSVSGADFMRTKEWVNVRRGMLRPRQLLIVSQRAFQVLKARKLKGCCFEVALVK